MKIWIFALCAAFFFCSSVDARTWKPASGYKQIKIWPSKAPGVQPKVGAETMETVTSNLVAGKPWLAAMNVTEPTITVYPPKGKNSGACVIVFPGGGYEILAMDLEGTEICDWLNSKGITAVLLKYRVPSKRRHLQSRIALQDGQRAISLVRHNAKKWKINPGKIGVLGFSAGGHLVAATSTTFKTRLYPAVDSIDKVSCRPNFAVALYPGHLWTNRKRFALNPTIPISKEIPPTFLLQAENDKVDPPEHSLVYYRALKRAGVPVEMHLYAAGGHAFGLRPTKHPITRWPKLVETWLETIGMVSG